MIKSDALKIILSKRSTRKEVSSKLVKKGYDPEAAEAAARYYEDRGYIDHADYAARFARDAALIKGQGAARIRAELKRRGVEERHIEDALSTLKFDVKAAMSKKFGAGGKIDFKTARKIKNHFLLKGFDAAEINGALFDLYEINHFDGR